MNRVEAPELAPIITPSEEEVKILTSRLISATRAVLELEREIRIDPHVRGSLIIAGNFEYHLGEIAALSSVLTLLGQRETVQSVRDQFTCARNRCSIKFLIPTL